MLSDESLELMHRFCAQWFCAYKKAIPLWIPDPEESAKRITSKDNKRKKDTTQTLMVYPTLWSLENDVTLDCSNLLVLYTQKSKKQKAEAFWGIRRGEIEIVACTYSQVFQDRGSLKKMVIYDSHTRYYKNAQDPRYQAVAVLEKMSEIYGSEIVKI
jgi:hypothetical protein